MTQPPLTRQIRQLEDNLGVELFARTTRHVELTEAGRAFIPEAEAILERLEQGLAVVQRSALGPAGRLVVGFEASINNNLIPRAVRRFRERYPAAEVVVRSLDTDQQIRALLEKKIDTGFVVPPIHDADVEYETVLEVPLVAVLPTAHPLAQRRGLEVAELAEVPFVLSSQAHRCGLYDAVIETCRRAGFAPQVRQEAHDMQLMLGFISEGVGATLLPDYVRQLNWPGVSHVALAPGAGAVEFALAWRRGDRSPVLAQFLRIARQCAEDARERVASTAASPAVDPRMAPQALMA